MADYVLEFGLTMVIFVLALGVALALFLSGAVFTLWAVHRGYVQTKATPEESPIIQSSSSTAEAGHNRGVVPISSAR